MRIVNDDGERLSAVDSFHPAWDTLHRSQPFADERAVQLQCLTQSHAGQGVVNVESARQPQVYCPRPAGSGYVHGQRARPILDVGGPNVRSAGLSVGDDARPGLRAGLDEERRGRIVGVHDRDPRPCPVEALGGRIVAESAEEAELGLAVRLECAVQLQVLVSQVGEDGHVVCDLGDAVQRQSMGSGFHDRGPIAGLHHGPQNLLQLGGLGSGDVLRVGCAQRAHFPGRRGDEARRDAAGLQDGRGQKGCRGLAVRAGDAYHSQLAAGVAVPPRGHGGQGAARIIDHDLRQSRGRNGPLDDRSGSAKGGCGHHVVVPVGMDARHSHEEGRSADVTRVERYAADLQCADARAGHDCGVAGRTPHRSNGPQPTRRLEPRDQLTQPPRSRRLGSGQETRHRFGACRIMGSGHSAVSCAGACGRPRTLRMP